MSPAHVLEPTYETLKRRLIDGYWPRGFRLEATKIADSLGVSMTPVRDSLYRLTGEQMVDFMHGEGFRVPALTETRLRDLFEFHNLLIRILMASSAQRKRPQLVAANNVAERTAQIFRHLSDRSTNAELAATVALLGDRLYAAWRVETEIFPALDSELAEIETALVGSCTADALLRGLLARYHDRRIAEAPKYVRIMGEFTMRE